MSLFARKPGKLRKLVIDRVDLVDAGANPDAHIMLYKSEDGAPYEIDKAAPPHQFVDANGDGKCDTCGMTQAQHQMMKSADAPEAPESVNKEAPVPTETQPNEADLNALQDAIDTAVTKALTDHDAALAELAKAETPAEESDPVAKALAEMPEPVRKRFEEQEAEIAKARSETEKLTKAARDARFADEAKNLSLTTVDAATLDAVEKAAPDAYETLAKALATCQERIAKSDLFREIGSNGDGAGDGSAADKLDAIAKGIATEKGVAFDVAYVEAVNSNRELASQAVLGG